MFVCQYICLLVCLSVGLSVCLSVWCCLSHHVQNICWATMATLRLFCFGPVPFTVSIFALPSPLHILVYIWTFFNNKTKRFSWQSCGMHHHGGQPTVRNVMLFGVINILLSCKPCLFISETMVHHDRASQTACYDFL